MYTFNVTELCWTCKNTYSVFLVFEETIKHGFVNHGFIDGFKICQEKSRKKIYS